VPSFGVEGIVLEGPIECLRIFLNDGLDSLHQTEFDRFHDVYRLYLLSPLQRRYCALLHGSIDNRRSPGSHARIPTQLPSL
jgi:hypothetical protein